VGRRFQNRRVNELIHSLGNGIMQPLQAVHAVFFSSLRKGIERLLGRAAMACRVSISSAMVTLPITVLLVGFTRS
jgi:hypothetical protein